MGLQERLFAGPLIAPPHWPTEIANAIIVAERRQRISENDRAVAFDDLRSLRVRIVGSDVEMVWMRSAPLAAEHRLTIYDAVYLQLAIEQKAILASNDKDLIDAARRCGVSVLTTCP